MDQRIVLEAVTYLEQQLIKSGLRISKLILFGSQATGQATEDSDIDIVILSEDFRNKDIFERARMIKEAEVLAIKKYMVPFDVITMTPEEFESQSSLVGLYAADGTVVYG